MRGYCTTNMLKFPLGTSLKPNLLNIFEWYLINSNDAPLNIKSLEFFRTLKLFIVVSVKLYNINENFVVTERNEKIKNFVYAPSY